MAKSLLIIFTQAPSASSANQEALDLALAAASFDQDVSLLFEGDASYQLVDQQTPDSVGRKNLPKMMKALPIYGIESVYIYRQPEMENLNVSHTATLLDAHSYAQLIAQSDTVIRF